MTTLERLRRLDSLLEFGWIKDNPGALTATKKLLRGLEKRGVKVTRRIPISRFQTSEYQPGFTIPGSKTRNSDVFRSLYGGGAFIRTSATKIPARITINRGTSGYVPEKPISSLWHEAGHHISRSSIPGGRPDVSVISPDVASQVERKANRGAILAMKKLGAKPRTVRGYMKGAASSYRTYDSTPGRLAWKP